MKLLKLTLENYKSHKHFEANFNGTNALVSGNKGSGKTSLKDAFYWLMTGSMVDDPTPVNENGEIINHLTIAVEGVFEGNLTLRVESKQRWSKEVLRQRHASTYFINGTPLLEKEYQAYLEENVATLEQRKILLDPTWFAYGDGLRTGGKTNKTAIQRRREIVIGVASAENLEKDIKDNEETAKQAKFAISKLKKELDDAYAGIESLHNAKLDTSNLDKDLINESINILENEKESTIEQLKATDSDNDTQNALRQAFNDIRTTLSEERANYTNQRQQLAEQAQKPLYDYQEKRRELESKLQQATFERQQQENHSRNLINEIEQLERKRNLLLEQYQEEKATVYVPGSTTCPSCGQGLPSDRLLEAEARFNKHKSDTLENIIKQGNAIKDQLELKQKEINLPKNVIDVDSLEAELSALVEPQVELPPTFEETDRYKVLAEAVKNAELAIENNSNEDVKAIYTRTIDGINDKIKVQRDQLRAFETNDHLEKEIDKKGVELQGISDRLDEQKDVLEACNEFTRKTLTNLEKTLEEKFKGIKFKMFEYTLDGSQKDTCITYAETPNGFIPWESLSGGQKRSATIKLANAFNKAWGVHLPLWIDDTQVYVEDELDANMQLIRITEVPHQELRVA